MAHPQEGSSCLSKKPVVVGVTGNVGSGKSFIMKMFRLLKVPTRNADVITRDLRQDPIIRQKIALLFPEAWEKTGLDFEKIAEEAFQNAAKRAALEDILHPEIYKKLELFIQEQRERRTSLIALEIPLLFETNREDLCDFILVTTAPPEVRAKRVFKERGWTLEKFTAIDRIQGDPALKIAKADVVISTEGGKLKTYNLFRNVWRKYKG